jgi:hypothetical protein
MLIYEFKNKKNKRFFLNQLVFGHKGGMYSGNYDIAGKITYSMGRNTVLVIQSVIKHTNADYRVHDININLVLILST